ncbi:hypothetical protein G9A89_006486 [Geosiphon pyriformis]|nr:hypothetical protein G9A89_006486 [Geosiphon pyriformis]
MNYLELFAVLLVSFLIQEIYKTLRKSYFGPLSHIPGPRLLPLTSLNFHPKYGPVVRIAENEIIVADKDAAKEILVTKDYPKSFIYSDYQHEGRETLFLSVRKSFVKERVSCSNVKTLRRLLSPAFSIKNLYLLEKLMRKCLENVVLALDEKLEAAPHDEGIILDIYRFNKKWALDIIGECAFGTSFGLVKTGQEHPLMNLLARNFLIRVLNGTLPFFKYFLKEDPYVIKFSQDLLNDRRQKGRSDIRDILQILVDSELSDDDIIEEITDFMLAGSDTTSHTASMAFILLVQNPEKMTSLRQELETNIDLNTSLSIAKHEDLKTLPYLNGVIHETMRLYPIGIETSSARMTTEDSIIGGYFIPKGTDVYISAYSIHHSKQYWGDDAEEFKPERWLDPLKVPRDAFHSFSAASEKSNGELLFMFLSHLTTTLIKQALECVLEIKLRLALATLILRYNFEEIKGQDVSIVSYMTPSLKTNRYDISYLNSKGLQDHKRKYYVNNRKVKYDFQEVSEGSYLNFIVKGLRQHNQTYASSEFDKLVVSVIFAPINFKMTFLGTDYEGVKEIEKTPLFEKYKDSLYIDHKKLVEPSTNQRKGKPPRPKNSWIIYKIDFEAKIRARCDGEIMEFSDIQRMASKCWKSETDERKSFFNLLSEMALSEHNKLYPKYKYRPDRCCSLQRTNSKPGPKSGKFKQKKIKSLDSYINVFSKNQPNPLKIGEGSIFLTSDDFTYESKNKSDFIHPTHNFPFLNHDNLGIDFGNLTSNTNFPNYVSSTQNFPLIPSQSDQMLLVENTSYETFFGAPMNNNQPVPSLTYTNPDFNSNPSSFGTTTNLLLPHPNNTYSNVETFFPLEQMTNISQFVLDESDPGFSTGFSLSNDIDFGFQNASDPYSKPEIDPNTSG